MVGTVLRDSEVPGVDVRGSTQQRLRKAPWSVQVEPVLAMFAMADSMVTVTLQSYYIDRICGVDDKLSPAVCQNLTFYPDTEKSAEKTVSEIFMYRILIESGFPVLLAMFIGPLTDRFGYKNLICYSLFGYCLFAASYMLSVLVPNLLPKLLLLASIPLALTGGPVLLFIASYAYLASQTNSENRSYRMAALTAVYDLGTVGGYVCGSQVLQHGGFLLTFLYIFAFYALSLLFALLFIRERRPENSELMGQADKSLMESLSMQTIKDLFCTSFQRRQGHLRSVICIISVSVCLVYLSWACISNQYLFVRTKFGWSAEEYAGFSATTTFLSGLGSTLWSLVGLMTLKLGDITIIYCNLFSKLFGYLTYAFAQNWWHMYLGSGILMFGSVTTPVYKSMLAKCVHKDEYCKLLSFVTCLELMMPFISGPLYTLIYISTVSVLPGAIFLAAAAFTIPVLMLALALHTLTKDEVSYGIMTENEE